MIFIKRYFDNTRDNSISNKFRRKRFSLFRKFIEPIPKPIKILDTGGTPNFWKQMNFSNEPGIRIVLLNISNTIHSDDKFKTVSGDARDLSEFKDKEFDVVFSNSVIEHVGNFNEQKRMADEIIRVSKQYFVQTPNYYFFFEPHYLFPFFQFFPNRIKIFLLTHFNMGWLNKQRNKIEALQIINSINLLKKKEIKKLFPNALIYKEKFLGFTKSFIIISSDIMK